MSEPENGTPLMPCDSKKGHRHVRKGFFKEDGIHCHGPK
jgi:hypothetical protein